MAAGSRPVQQRPNFTGAGDWTGFAQLHRWPPPLAPMFMACGCASGEMQPLFNVPGGLVFVSSLAEADLQLAFFSEALLSTTFQYRYTLSAIVHVCP